MYNIYKRLELNLLWTMPKVYDRFLSLRGRIDWLRNRVGCEHVGHLRFVEVKLDD